MKLTFVDQYDLHYSVHRNVDFVGAHAVTATVWWLVVSVAEHLGRNVVYL